MDKMEITINLIRKPSKFRKFFGAKNRKVVLVIKRDLFNFYTYDKSIQVESIESTIGISFPTPLPKDFDSISFVK